MLIFLVGGLSIAAVRNTSAGRLGVAHLTPLFKRDFDATSLPQRIADLRNLIWLYLRIAKEEAFGIVNGVATVVRGYVNPEQRVSEDEPTQQ